MKINNRKAVSDSLKKFDPQAKESDFIEITEWTNTGGIDILISDSSGDKIISLSYDELEAIKYLELALRYEKVEE